MVCSNPQPQLLTSVKVPWDSRSESRGMASYQLANFTVKFNITIAYSIRLTA